MGIFLLVALAACRAAPGPVARCPGSDPAPVPGYEGYRYAEVQVPDGETHASNWAWQETRRVTVDVDVGSFADVVEGHRHAEDAVLDVVERAVAFWNAAADVELVLGDLDARCCEAGSADCHACGRTRGVVALFMAAEADDSGLPAFTRPAFGDDPATDAVEPACLVAGSVRFHPGGTAADGTPVSYAWVEEGRDVRDVDPSDGTLEKPLHDTLVHELGHALGLGDQDDPAVGCSVMAHCADPACGCDYDVIGPVDAAALGEVYGG